MQTREIWRNPEGSGMTEERTPYEAGEGQAASGAVDLMAIRVRAEAATAGRMEHGHGPRGWFVESVVSRDVIAGGIKREANAAFFAHARADIPALLAEVAALTAERDALRAALGLMYSKYENGMPCYTDPEASEGYLGAAVMLDPDEDAQVVAALKALGGEA